MRILIYILSLLTCMSTTYAQCDLELYGFDVNTGDVTIIVNNGENCGCNINTNTSNTCENSGGFDVNNNSSVTSIVLGLHIDNWDAPYLCANSINANHPGWTFLLFSNDMLGLGANTGDTLNFNIYAYNNLIITEECWIEFLPMPPVGECYELVIWQINLSQTVNLVDFPNNGWTPYDIYNQTQNYPDLNFGDNRLVWCTNEPQDPLYPGCMDSGAVNFNPTSTYDDGSCEYIISGCMDPTSCTYDSNATQDDGSCEYCGCWWILCGCTDILASNYNVDANYDDGSCEYGTVGCDTIYITQTDTLYITQTDTLYITQTDTLYITQTDTITEYITDTITEYVYIIDTTYIEIEVIVTEYVYVTDTITEFFVVTEYIDCSSGELCNDIYDPCSENSIYAPNAVTPNADGSNDTWFVVADEQCWSSWEVRIYNRWGGLVWISTNILDEWDANVATGVYVYTITAHSAQTTNVYQFNGTITVLY